MRFCIIGKFPPIQGGVSSDTYWTADFLARCGHQVWVVSNADQVEPEYRMAMTPRDRAMREPRHGRGFVELATREPPESNHYIPFAPPYVTQLAARATEVVRRHRCDLIFAYYFEPYAVAACLASTWTGVPFVVRHAGTDVGRLLENPALRTTYVEVLRRAAFVLTRPDLEAMFVGLGVPRNRVMFCRGTAVPTHLFHPRARRLDVDRTLAALVRSNRWLDPIYARLGRKRFDPGVPTIGMYGKLAEARGSWDLLHALAANKRRGRRFQLLAVVGGRRLPAYAEALAALGLEDRTWLLPFVAHWRIPAYLRTLTALCSLERLFSIEIHVPVVPREALACGTCLLLSQEISDKPGALPPLQDGDNYILIRDPRDHRALADRLARVIAAPAEAKAIGMRGHLLSTKIERLDASIAYHDKLFRLLSTAAAPKPSRARRARGDR